MAAQFASGVKRRRSRISLLPATDPLVSSLGRAAGSIDRLDRDARAAAAEREEGVGIGSGRLSLDPSEAISGIDEAIERIRALRDALVPPIDNRGSDSSSSGDDTSSLAVDADRNHGGDDDDETRVETAATTAARKRTSKRKRRSTPSTATAVIVPVESLSVTQLFDIVGKVRERNPRAVREAVGAILARDRAGAAAASHNGGGAGSAAFRFEAAASNVGAAVRFETKAVGDSDSMDTNAAEHEHDDESGVVPVAGWGSDEEDDEDRLDVDGGCGSDDDDDEASNEPKQDWNNKKKQKLLDDDNDEPDDDPKRDGKNEKQPTISEKDDQNDVDVGGGGENDHELSDDQQKNGNKKNEQKIPDEDDQGDVDGGDSEDDDETIGDHEKDGKKKHNASDATANNNEADEDDEKNDGKETKIQKMSDEIWHAHLAMLKKYQASRGTVHISHSVGLKEGPHKALCLWTWHQRHEYSNMQKGVKSSLNLDKIGALDELGFDWGSVPQNSDREDCEEAAPSEEIPPEPAKKKIHRADWWERLVELQRYKDEHGTMVIPYKVGQTDGPHRELCRWTTLQRAEYSRLQRGKRSSLSRDKISALEEMEFKWRVLESVDGAGAHSNAERAKCAERHKARKEEWARKREEKAAEKAARRAAYANKHDSEWRARLEELKAYASETGTANIPPRFRSRDQPEGPLKTLAAWCCSQRSLYTRALRGEKCSLSQERIEALREVGFDLGKKFKMGRPVPGGGDDDEVAQFVEEALRGEADDGVRVARVDVGDGTACLGASEPRAKKSSKVMDWKVRFEELRAYSEEHGVARLPWKIGMQEGPHRALYHWTNLQRREWLRLQEGKKSRLTDEKIKALEGIGFEFVLNKTPRHSSMEE